MATVSISEVGGGQVLPSQDGTFNVTDQRTYLLSSEGPLPSSRYLQVLPIQSGYAAELCFENYVGLADLGGIRFRVRNSKLTDPSFEKLLAEVVETLCDLAFDFGSPTALPFDRTDVLAEGILYHTLLYLRHIMLSGDRHDRLSSQFLAIARRPNRLVQRESSWIEPHRASSVDARTVNAIVSHPDRLVPLPLESRLASTGLGKLIGRRRPLFPGTVVSERRTESYDTVENRLVRHFLATALSTVEFFRRRPRVNAQLLQDLEAMKEELNWMLQFEFLNDIGEMTIVPCQSTVLASQAGYREIYRHYTQLQQAALVDAGDNTWERLLELKDVALLYELWSFCETKRTVEKLLGRATNVHVFASDELRRTMKRGISLEYAGGKASLSYNETFTPGKGSYSVSLRPDIVLRVRSASSSRCLLLDAKLRFDGAKLKDDRLPEEWERNPVREDLVKMHAYRDAIHGVDGAYVLYPGSETVLFRTRDIDPHFFGIGAVPLEPNGDRDALKSLLNAFLGHYKLT